MLDPASLQILISRLEAIAEEMGAVLRRSAYSPNINERADASSAVFDPRGELLAQAEHIPVHLGAMPFAVRAVIDAGLDLRDGDHVLHNDPFVGGTHLNDVTLVSPCFASGDLVGWVANRAHHADVGGAAPGSLPADAVDIFQEGLRLPPVVLTADVQRVFVANSRTPLERGGDLAAQIGANEIGIRGLRARAADPLHEIVAYGERRMREALRRLPDGVWTADDAIDSFGAAPAQRQPRLVTVRVAVQGEEITFDFTGSAAQTLGNMNASLAVTVSAVAYALRVAVDPTLPANGGALRPVTVIAPAGSMLNASAPAAVGAGNVEVSQRVADICLAALGQIPGCLKLAGSQGTMNNVLIGGDGWVYYETIGGGEGAGSDRAGDHALHTHMTNTLNTPIEVLERSFPLRVRTMRVHASSGGAGAHRGGDGIERAIEFLAPARVSLISERRTSAPAGAAGGQAGARGVNSLERGLHRQPLADKALFDVEACDVLRIATPGGGGYGTSADSV